MLIRVLALFCVALTGCAAPRSSAPNEPIGHKTSSGARSVGFEDFALSVHWVPDLIARSDKDTQVNGSGLEFEADLGVGDGYEIRLQQYGESGFALGLNYLTTEHAEKDTNTRARTHSGTVEIGLNRAFNRDGPLVSYAEIAGGLGVAGIDFNGSIDDSFGGAASGRALFGVRILDALDLTVEGGLFLWGYPGETIGRGAYWAVGGTVRF